MVCEYYGKCYTVDYLSRYCHVTKEGMSLYGISEAAEKLGLQTMSGRVSLDMLANAPLPCILHRNQNHYVVLYKIRKNKYYIADPGKGLLKINKDEFVEHWVSTRTDGIDKGIGLFFRLTPDFINCNKNVNTGKNLRSFKFLFSYVKQYQKYFLQIVFGLVVVSLLQLLFPFLTQSVIDVGIKGKDIGFIVLVLLAQLMLVFSSTVISYIRSRLLLHISMRINLSLVSDFFIKLLKLPMAFFDTKMIGDLLQRMEDHSRVEKFLTTNLLNVIFSMVTFIAFSIVLLVYNELIFFIYFITSFFYVIWIMLFMRYRRVLDYKMFEQQAINNNKTYQFLGAMQEIKLQDCEQRRRWEWEDVQTDLFNVNMKFLNLQQIQGIGSVFINETKNIIITILSATLVIRGELTLGMMMAIQYMIGQLNAPISTLVNFIYSLQDVIISLERINEIHNKPDESDESKIIVDRDSLNNSLSLENVSFKYNPHQQDWTLRNINIFIKKGTTTAIVGVSGSGKTTLLKLLLGFYLPCDGYIKIGDHNLDNINLKQWRRSCGVVMQDGVIFSESIARNIAVDDSEIDFDRLIYAARIACIDKFIDSLPLKYNTILGSDGMGISQGQKQRILIARAIYKCPDFIFLDEATNSLDANNERDIVENLNDFFCGRTVIIIAHRLSTVKNADNIVVIDKGSIVEQGSHNTLIAKRGEYYRLVKNQLELGN